MVDEQPLRRRWVPTDEAGLRSAFDRGAFDERNWCELKTEVGDTKSANAELGRDLASLAVDGGTFLIGLDERAPNGDPLHPVMLAGLSERVEQVAATRVHPPLMVECTPVESSADSTKGYVVVHVPASPLAPHQVEGAYYGRGDKTKRRLSDPEVERLFDRRRTWSQDALEVLDRVMAFRQAGAETKMPQLFLAARPAAARPEMLRAVVGSNNWLGSLEKLRVAICNDDPSTVALAAQFPGIGWHGNFGDTRKLEKTATGGRIGSGPNYLPTHAQDWSFALDIDEAGTMALASASVGDVGLDFNGIKYTAVYVDLVAVAMMEFLAAARNVSTEDGYISAWDFAVEVTNLHATRAAKSHVPRHMVGYPEPAYDAASYRQSTRADCLELERAPAAVFERLIGLYLRGAQMDDYLRPLMDARTVQF